jgi:hypothetical protein
MKMYYFFEKDEKGQPDYGEQYFVMSDSLEDAKKAVVNCEEYKQRSYSNIENMGYSVHGINEVVQTEIS